MESDEVVYSDWVVVVSDGRTYLGRLEEHSNNHVLLAHSFELRTLEMRRPDPTGRGVEMTLQNVFVQDPLCTEGVDAEFYVTKIKYFSGMTDVDRREHIKFVQAAEKAFVVQRAKASGIEIASA